MKPKSPISALGLFYPALALSSTLLVVVFLKGDLVSPIGFGSDGLYYHALASVVLKEGWWTHSLQLGGPFGAPFVSFPSNSNVDFALVWLAGLFTKSVPQALVFAWTGMLVLGGIGCGFCARCLGISKSVAFVLGLLFAVMPFAVYRNVGQFSLAPYLIVYPATIAVIAFSGDWKSLPRSSRWLLIGGTAAVGANYIYYAFFACFLLLLAVGVQVARKNRPWFQPAAVALAVIIAATAINLLPSLVEWMNHGSSPNVRPKQPQEFDFYALKIRHLFTPLWEHSFPPFHAWLAKDYAADFPLETENTTTRMGVIGSLGLLILLLTPVLGDRLWPAQKARLGQALLILTVALLLYAVPGGLGSLFNLLVTPEIRAANRVAPFIYFFSLIGLGLQIDRIGPLWRSVKRWHSILALFVLTGVGSVGIYDQSHAFIGVNRSRRDSASHIKEVASFVRTLEEVTPAQALVFQLPFREFLNDDGVMRMAPYAHFEPAVFSTHLRWSYPSMSHQSQLWTAYARSLSPAQIGTFLRASGFKYVWFDAFGYGPEAGPLLAALGEPLLESSSGRYKVFDLSKQPSHEDDPTVILAADRLMRARLRLSFSKGFYPAESIKEGITRWSRRVSQIILRNEQPHSVLVSLNAEFTSLVGGPVAVEITLPDRSIQLQLTNSGQPIAIPLKLEPNSFVTLTLEQHTPTYQIPTDRRELYFRITNPYLLILN